MLAISSATAVPVMKFAIYRVIIFGRSCCVRSTLEKRWEAYPVRRRRFGKWEQRGFGRRDRQELLIIWPAVEGVRKCCRKDRMAAFARMPYGGGVVSFRSEVG